MGETMKTKNLTFKEAYKALQDGKRIRRMDWSKNSNWRLIGSHIVNSADMNLDDWEIVEEKKTLSDDRIEEIDITYNNNKGRYYHEEDVKEALRKFVGYVQSEVHWNFDDWKKVLIKAKEIFGERLIG